MSDSINFDFTIPADGTQVEDIAGQTGGPLSLRSGSMETGNGLFATADGIGSEVEFAAALPDDLQIDWVFDVLTNTGECYHGLNFFASADFSSRYSLDIDPNGQLVLNSTGGHGSDGILLGYSDGSTFYLSIRAIRESGAVTIKVSLQGELYLTLNDTSAHPGTKLSWSVYTDWTKTTGHHTRTISAFTPVTTLVSFPVDHANIVYRKEAVRITGSGYAQMPTRGEMCDFSITGTTRLVVRTNTRNLLGNPDIDYPTIRVWVDESVEDTIVCPPRIETDLVLLDDLDPEQTYRIRIEHFSIGGGWTYNSRWNIESNGRLNVCLLINAFKVDIGGSILAPSVPAKTWLAFGDSITENEWSSDNGPDLVAGNPRNVYVVAVAEHYGLRLVRHAYAGTGFITPAPDGVPNAATHAGAYDSGYSLLVDGKFPSDPDVISVNYGTNDAGSNPSDVIEAVLILLSTVRAAARMDVPIFLIIPFGSQQRAAIIEAFESQSDPQLYLLDTTQVDPLQPSDTPDGIHPYATVHARLAGDLIDQIDQSGAFPPAPSGNAGLGMGFFL